MSALMTTDATTTQEKNPATSQEDGCGMLVIGKKFDWLTGIIGGELEYAIMAAEEDDGLVAHAIAMAGSGEGKEET